MALSVTQRTDMQADLGISSDETVFTNAELDRLYARADSDYNSAVYLAWRQLMADTAKFNDYVTGETEEKKSQLFDHVKKMVDFWSDEARAATNQVRMLSILEVPPRHKDKPSG